MLILPARLLVISMGEETPSNVFFVHEGEVESIFNGSEDENVFIKQSKAHFRISQQTGEGEMPYFEVWLGD